MPLSAQAPWFVKAESRGIAHSGMVPGSGLGRDDQLPLNVASGSYVVPADLVSGIGEGSSQAGAAILGRMFNSGPLGMAVPHVHGSFGGPRTVRPGMMKLPRGAGVGSVFTRTKTPGFADGGQVQQRTPIVAASGEFIIPAHEILRRWGDLKKGHDILDKWVIDQRAKHAAKLKALPPPVKR